MVTSRFSANFLESDRICDAAITNLPLCQSPDDVEAIFGKKLKWKSRYCIWSSENKAIPNSKGDHCVFKQKQSGTIGLFPKAWFTAMHWFTLPETNIEPENRIKGYHDIWWLNKCMAGMILDNFHKHGQWNSKKPAFLYYWPILRIPEYEQNWILNPTRKSGFSKGGRGCGG